MQEEEFLHFGNERYIYQLFESYQKDKSSVPVQWLRFFQGMELASSVELTSNAPVAEGKYSGNFDLQRVIDYFKRYGHLFANTNSLLTTKEFDLNVLLSELNIKQEDLDSIVSIKEWNIPDCKLSELINILQQRYCNGLGIEFFGVDDKAMEDWVHTEINTREAISKEEIVNALKEVGKAKLLESFLHKKFLGAKRFSVEGGESVLALLKVILDEGGNLNYKESYIGMAHRGRVNTLCHIMEKPYKDIFAEFKADRFPLNTGLGDVKYHNGYQNTVKTYSGKEIFLQMAANPSHLEAVDGVLPGMIRARLDEGLEKALGIVVHGDASVSGQGIVYETMQFDKLQGYTNGGTIHIIIDNYIGFTAHPEESRSTLYPSDIAKTFSIPVLHVDAASIPEVVYAARLAVKFHEKFKTDIFIHYNCHRLYGHNEADEPTFTNPSLYGKIKQRDDLYTALKHAYLEEKLITEEEITNFEEAIKGKLNDGLETIEPGNEKPLEELVCFDNSLEEGGDAYPPLETKISKEVYNSVKDAISCTPEGFHMHRKIVKLLESRKHALETENEYLLDWGCAELMAYGSLVVEGKSVRLSGQDSRRGTFSHRHSVYVDQEVDDTPYFPLDKLKKGAFTVYNSPLSEYGVMGFEYGYSLKSEKGLVIWEGQFGDFFNGGSIITDQFISATKSKWGEDSALILYLPHGMEGMGPEHSSARIERFLQLAGRKSMRIFYPTTPGQIFHLIRSQANSDERIPLVVFTPKSMLRHQGSCAKELLEGKLEQIIIRGTGEEKKLVFCSGKIGLEIENMDKDQTCAIVRIEQLYPFPEAAIKAVIEKFSNANKFIYAQEEAKNQGAYLFVRDYLQQIIGKKGTLEYVGRKRLESTSTGYSVVHKYNQERIIKKVVEG